jgi:hypothetical protein
VVHDPRHFNRKWSGLRHWAVTIALVSALSLGWLGGSSFYDWLYFRAPAPIDRVAMSALIEKIVAEPNKNQGVDKETIGVTKSRESGRSETKSPLGYVIGN